MSTTESKSSSSTTINNRVARSKAMAKIFDDPAVIQGYASVPLIDIDSLPRGGLSFETKSVGRIQFGIPPETIKDSMQMGIEVPRVYIVPVERFCRETGPSLGVNLAEFEFPAYFNYFIKQKKCTLVVDTAAAERDIRSVFSETLLGPDHFRDHTSPLANFDDDFDPTYPKDKRPNFYKELDNFRGQEKNEEYDELTIDRLLDFVHYKSCRRNDPYQKEKLGVPPAPAVQIEGFSSPTRGVGGGDTTRPKLNFPEAKLDEFRRNSLYSQASTLSQDLSFAADSASSPKLLFPRRRSSLQRRNSDSSLSKSSRTSNSHNNNSHGSTTNNEDNSSSRHQNRRATMMNKRSSWYNTTSNRDFARYPEGLNVTDHKPWTSFRKRRESASRFEHSFSNLSRGSLGTGTASGTGGMSGSSIDSYDFMIDDEEHQDSNWMYSQAQWLGDVATIFPADATPEQKSSKNIARVELFRMAGGTEYIVHDIDENNVIVGKVRFSGTVQTPDEFSVLSFAINEDITDRDTSEVEYETYEDALEPENRSNILPFVQSTFHPPSFGVTVLGNSHGFDKNGSTSGYVLWVNGRGIMVDPPPYSNVVLEREGIRPQMIMGIIITHCHADHDAGAFQKVMRGSRVALITTPTIYNSFIRKYSALSGLKPNLLRHSHRHRPAIIGQPLRFQGAVFHFTYSLHTIPCISFKVEWRGRSIVFTGDHMNIPKEIDRLEQVGVLSKARADDLRQLPIQNCDVLLHEAGVPPIHTPLSVLEKLPKHVQDRLYIVHTAAIPPDCNLKVAPTGTIGTIRLDSLYSRPIKQIGSQSNQVDISAENLQDGSSRSQNLTMTGNHHPSVANQLMKQFNGQNGKAKVAPLVFLRPTDVSDAWFILNLLSAVPFLSSLSYGHTMEFLEIAHVEMYCKGETVIQGSRRPEILCVFWEGTCTEIGAATVWHAGDWTGPASLQPDLNLAATGTNTKLEDIVAISEEGVKVITLLMKDVLKILKSGSKLFRKHMALKGNNESTKERSSWSSRDGKSPVSPASEFSIHGAIKANSVLRNLSSNQRLHLESLAEGPRFFAVNAPLWKYGDPVEYALIIVEGTATIGQKRETAPTIIPRDNRRGSTGGMASSLVAIDEQAKDTYHIEPIANVQHDRILQNFSRNSEYSRLEECLKQMSYEIEDAEEEDNEINQNRRSRPSFTKANSERRSTTLIAQRDRFVNKVMARLYTRRAYTRDLVFSKGAFLSDTSRMICGDLAIISKSVGLRSSISMAPPSSDHHCHTSTVVAGPQGCIAMVFPKSSLVPFLDGNPGVLLSLLGTKVLV